MSAAPQLTLVNLNVGHIASERKSQQLVMAFFLSGMFFMLLPEPFGRMESHEHLPRARCRPVAPDLVAAPWAGTALLLSTTRFAS